jgi:hypothetical protein
MKRNRFLLAFAAAIPLMAAGVSGPVLGYVHRDATVRPIVGIPGASHFGAAIETGDLVIEAVSSSAGYAIAFTPDRTQLHILALQAGVPARRLASIDDASTIDSVVLSASGTALAAVRARDRRVDIFTGLPSSPAMHKTLATAFATGGAIAVSDDGDAVAIAEGATILSVFERDQARQIAAAGLRHVSFRPASHDFTYIDGDLVVSVSGGISTLVAASADGVSDARTALRSRDGRSVLIFNAGGKQLLVARDGTTQSVETPCTASEIESLAGSDFRISCESSGRVHLIDLSGAAPRILFVPEPVE